MIAIIAVNNLGYIGKDNKMLWHSAADLAHFKFMTQNKIMMAGWNTYQTLPNAVKNRGVILDERHKYISTDQM